MGAVVSLDGYIARTDGVRPRSRRPASSPATGTSTLPPGEVGGQAVRLGLLDQVVINVVPVVFGAGRPFFAAMGPGDVALANPSRVVQGDRVSCFYDVASRTPQDEQ